MCFSLVTIILFINRTTKRKINVTKATGTPYCRDKLHKVYTLDDINVPEEKLDKTITLITVNPVNKLTMPRVWYDCLLIVNS